MQSLVLKSCAQSWATPLAVIFRKSIDSGEVSDAWLEANVTPLYKKKGSRLDAVNFRLISPTSVTCKIIEKIVKKSVIIFLNANSLLSKNQHGLRNKKSCTCTTHVLISNNLKFTCQANKAASVYNKKLGMLKRTFRYRGAGMWKKLYTSYVRPQLEFAIPVLNPYLKGDIDTLERVKYRANKNCTKYKKS